MPHKKRYSRRQYLKSSAALASFAAIAGCTSNGDDGSDESDGSNGSDGDGGEDGSGDGSSGGTTGGGSETIKIGALFPLAPPLQQLATQGKRGMQIATERINNNGGIDGNDVEVIYENTQADPDTGLQKARRLVENENVDMLYGGIVSSTALAVTEYANRRQVPYFTNASADPLTGESCKKSTFVLNPSEAMRGRALGPSILERSGTKGWMHIFDYAWGHSVNKAWSAALEAQDQTVDIVDTTKSPLSATDFSDSITQIASADVDWAILGLGGAALAAFLKQASQYDLQDSVDIYGPEAVQSARRDGGDTIRGMITHGRYSPHYDTEPNNAFVQAFTEEHELPPNQNAKDAWEGIHFYKAAVEENGSKSFGDVTAAAEEVTIDSLMGSLSMRDCDHRCVRPMHVAEVGENDEWGVPRFNILETVPAEQVMESCEQTTCSF